MFKKTSPYFLFLLIFILSACSDKVVEQAEKVQEVTDEEETQMDANREKQLEVLDENETTIDEAIELANEEREIKKKIDPTRDISDKEEFTDKEEFSQFVAKTLYHFQSQEISAEDYYNFIITHGSRVLLHGVDEENKNLMIEGFSATQNQMNEKNLEYSGYTLSEITLDEAKIYGYFYRTVIRGDNELNYITTIVKQGNEWKFDSDHLSIGYEEGDNE